MIDFEKYKNFLSSEDVYNDNIDLYKKLIDKATSEKTSEWVITKYANGKEIMNGNPIFATFIEKKQIAIRIIQSKIDINTPIFSTWINKNPFEMTGIQELVVSLQLRQDTYEDLSYLLEKFINRNLSNAIIKFLNDKYHRLWNEKILVHTVHSSKQNKKLSDILNGDFVESNFTLRKLKSDAGIFENIFYIFLVDYKFPKNELNTSIRGLKNATEKLYDTLTIKNKIETIKTSKTNNNHIIIKLIKSQYSNVNNFKEKLRKDKKKFEDELTEIEHLIC